MKQTITIQRQRFYRRILAGLVSAIFLAGVPSVWAADFAIVNNPATSVFQDEFYEFVPEVENADGNVSFAITGRPAWATFNATTGTLSGTPTRTDVRSYSGITITATDAGPPQRTDAVGPFTITVQNIDDRPVINNIGAIPATATEDAFFSFQISVTEYDGDTVTYSLLNAPAWLTVSSGGLLSGTPPDSSVGEWTGIVLKVADPADPVPLSTTGTFDLTVLNVNDPPTISGTPPQTAVEDVLYSFTPISNDPDLGLPGVTEDLDFTLTYAGSPAPLPTWLSFDPNTGRISGTPGDSVVGTTVSNIVIRVTDDAGLSDQLAPFSITVQNVNDAPVIFGNPPTTVAEDSPYSFTPAASDADFGDTANLTFFIANRPSWATFNATTGRLSGTPRNQDVRTYDGIVISVSDGNGGQADLGPFSITVTNTNDPPIISGNPPTVAIEDSPYTFSPTVTEVDVGDNLDYTITWNGQPSKPQAAAWLAVNTTENVLTLSGTPDNDDVGNTVANILISVTDGNSPPVSLNPFSIVILNTNDPPTISGNPNGSVQQGNQYTFTPNVNDTDPGEELTFTLTVGGASPPPGFWLELDPDTGVLSGTPENEDVGEYNDIRLSVRDAAGATPETPLAPFSITVTNRNDAPEFTATPASVVNVNEDQFYVFTVRAEDPDNGIGLPDTFAFSMNGNPSWLTLDPDTGVLSGTPRDADVTPVGNPEDITITVEDDQGARSTYEFDLNVRNTNDPPVFVQTPTGPIDLTENESAGSTLFTFGATDDDIDSGDSILYGLENAPNWLEMDPLGGALRSSRALDDADVGIVSNVRATATDLSGGKATFTFSLDVQNVNDPPVIDKSVLTTVITIQEDTSLFLDGEDYITDEDLVLGSETLLIQLSGANLPAWITVDPANGDLAINPPADFSGNITGLRLTVEDSTDLSDSQNFQVRVINENDKPVISGTPPGAFVGQFFEFAPVVTDGDPADLPISEFRIQNQPVWTEFDSDTGVLSGTPTAPGLFANVRIIANDGKVDSDPLVFDLRVLSGIAVTPGDVNADGSVNLTDAILALKVVAGVSSGTPVFTDADVNGDGRIGVEEAIFALREIGL